jgi:hypothetical protein
MLDEFERFINRLSESGHKVKFGQEEWAKKQYSTSLGYYFKIDGRRYSYVKRPRSGLAKDKDDCVIIHADKHLIKLLEKFAIKYEEW